jgi:hypothetical protein
LTKSQVAEKMEQARAPTPNSSIASNIDLEKTEQQPNRNLAALSALVKDKKPEEEVKQPDESQEVTQDHPL